MKNNYT